MPNIMFHHERMKGRFATIRRKGRLIGVLLALILALSQPVSSLAADEQVKIIPNLEAPDLPSGLLQLTFDNTKPIPVGGSVNTNQFVARSLIHDPDAQDSLVIEIEIRPVGVAFLNQPNYASPTIPSAGSVIIAPILLSSLPEGQYHWQERVRDGAGHITAWVAFGGNDENVSDLTVDQTAPDGLKGVQITAGVKSSTITWARPTDPDTAAIDVLRGTTPNSVTDVIAQIDATQTSFTDTGLNDGVIYWYALRAKDIAGNASAPTLPVSVVTDIVIDESDQGRVTFVGTWGEVTGLPEALATKGTFRWAPGDSGATVSYVPVLPTAGQYEVRVSWLVNPPNFVGKQATNAPYVVSDASGQKVVYIDQSKLADGSVNQAAAWSGWYSLGIYTVVTDRPFSVSLVSRANGYLNTDATRFVSIRPLPPTNFIASDHPNDNGGVIDLRWQPSPSSTVNRYRIYRATSASGYDLTKPLAEVSALEYTDATAATSQTYFYAITAFDGTRESIPSVEQSAIAIDQVAPDRPRELNITDGDGFLSLSWPAVADAADYELTVKVARTGQIISTMVIPADQTTTKITGLSNEEIYIIDLIAIDSSKNRSMFIGVLGQPKAPKIEPVRTTVSRPAAVKAAMTPVPSRQPTFPKIEQPKQPPVEVERSPAQPEEGKVKGAQNERPEQNRLLITLLILAIAIVVGIGGYYGYDWWFAQSEREEFHLPDEGKMPDDQRPPAKPLDKRSSKQSDIDSRPKNDSGISPEDRSSTSGRW